MSILGLLGPSRGDAWQRRWRRMLQRRFLVLLVVLVVCGGMLGALFPVEERTKDRALPQSFKQPHPGSNANGFVLLRRNPLLGSDEEHIEQEKEHEGSSLDKAGALQDNSTTTGFRRSDGTLDPFTTTMAHQALSHYGTGSSVVSLNMGELPGYTGWARPAVTTASWYSVRYPMGRRPQVGIPFVMHIVCNPPKTFMPQETPPPNQQRRAMFYLRAYGPTLVTGTVQRRRQQQTQTEEPRNQTNSSFQQHKHKYETLVWYEATLLFLKPGKHFVEVVLTFSHVPSIQEFPLTVPEPAYEGYLLPHMPALLTVVPSWHNQSMDVLNQSETSSNKSTLPLCGRKDLYETSTTSALQQGTWTVVSKVMSLSPHGLPRLDENNETVFGGYQQGHNSIGFQMEYQMAKCHLLPLKQLVDRFPSNPDTSDIYLVFVGDSNMMALQKVLEQQHFFNRVQSIVLRTNDGLHMRLQEIQQGLHQLMRDSSPTTKFFLFFNAGLHDIARLCSHRFVHSRQQNLGISEQEFSCVTEYRKNLEKLVSLIQAFPFQLRVFQTTTAGWLKWGNYGFSWPATQFQEYPLDSQACHEFNQIAWHIMQDHDIPVVDAFWLSLSRPDHRQIDAENRRGKKLVHLGVELYHVLLRKWLSLVAESLLLDKQDELQEDE